MRLAATIWLPLLAACAAPPPAKDAGQWISAPDAPSAARPPPAAVPLEACGAHAEGFAGWLASFRGHAVAQGLSEATVARALDGLAYDPAIIELDRTQKPFKATAEEYAARHVTARRVARGRELLRAHADLFRALEARFGVAPSVLVAIWGLETDFGANTGSTPILRSLATLAYDCRRAARFRGELLSALRLVERGDLDPEAVGSWAGEIGQTQFLPSSYERFAVDFDGDGRADLTAGHADALASTASYLAGHGWKPREPFGEGTANHAVLAEWNASEVVRKAIALFAKKLDARRAW